MYTAREAGIDFTTSFSDVISVDEAEAKTASMGPL